MNSETIHPKYRADIDGLRAIAIMIVVAFHAFPEVVHGGFVGVDVFFVISGFLISTIIFSNVDRGAFRLADFYARRIRRIFPTLVVALSAAMAIGWFVLLPNDYAQLGRHVAAGAAFVSNYALWSESGYFDTAAETKPLLHLWSLAIEEQFYLIFPLLILATKRFAARRTTVLWALAALSFGLNIIEIHPNPIKAFYSPQTRFWELLVGAVLAQMMLDSRTNTSEKSRSIIGILGLASIGLAAFLLDDKRHFPGTWALLPTIGAALLISAGPNGLPNRYLLSRPFMVFIGRISYPIYLWHWILLSYVRIIEDGDPALASRVLAVIASVILAWLTFKLVESPLRFGHLLQLKTVGLAATMIAVAVSGVSIVAANGLPFRMKDRVEFDAYFENSIPKLQYSERSGVLEYYRNDCNFYNIAAYRARNANNIPVNSIAPSCTAATPGKKSVFLWGDSHVEQLYYGLITTLPKDWEVLIVASSGCVPDTSVKADSSTDYCVRSNWYALNAIKEIRPDVIVVAQSTGHEISAMETVTQGLHQLSENSRVVFTGPVPHWNTPLYKVVSSKFWLNTPRRTFYGMDQNVIARDRQLQSNLKLPPYASFVSLVDVLCDNEGCLTYLGDDRMRGITTWDVAHLTLPASEFVAKQALASAVLGRSVASVQ